MSEDKKKEPKKQEEQPKPAKIIPPRPETPQTEKTFIKTWEKPFNK